jgi:hypothetical protein
LAAKSKALDLLETVSSMVPAPTGASPVPGERHSVLEKIHAIKDRNVFRILGTITHPNHSVNARIRAIDDLPKRVKAAGAGEAATGWIRTLVKRCAMGDFLNQDIVHHCILLAHECFHNDEFDAAQRFLTCVQMAAMRFPQLCASQEDFITLTELFRDCSSIISPRNSSSKRLIKNSGMMTSLSAILAAASPYRAYSDESIKCEEDIHKQLINLCRDGTPEQARHATATMIALLKPKEGLVLTQEENDAFLPLLQTLATSSQLSMASINSSTELASVLVALAELGEHAPMIFQTEKLGKSALEFALNTVLLGHKSTKPTGYESDDARSKDSSEDESVGKTPIRRRRSKAKKATKVEDHLSPSNHHKNLVDDDNLSISCRTLCAAIEFIATIFRSSVFTNKRTKVQLSGNTEAAIESFFDSLSNIIRDEGMPPSSRDRTYFNLRQDRAALRQCAAIHLLRLCDTRLGLDQKFLTIQRWHLLSQIFLDDERHVRTAVMEELGEMLTANGKYAVAFGQGAMAPRLRFLAYVVFCSDGDHNANHSAANGGAANVGKYVHSILGNAHGCVAYLRRVYEAGEAQARANGEDAEQHYQTFTKVTVMPEYSVPYACHLLAFRRETPLADGKRRKRNSDEDFTTTCTSRSDDDKAVSVLGKRIRNLFEILTATADGNNVSFLLRMTEIISSKVPKLGSNSGVNIEDHQRKLLKVCQVSREVLLSLVKRDENLTAFPGKIFIPGNLFGQGRPKEKVLLSVDEPILEVVRADDEANEDDDIESTPRDDNDIVEDKIKEIQTSQSLEDLDEVDDGCLSSHLDVGSQRRSRSERIDNNLDGRFIPERTPNKSVHFSPDKPMEFTHLSPIVKSASPNDDLLTSGETKTRGSTPPTQQPRLSTATSKSPTPVSSDSFSKGTDVPQGVSTPKSFSRRRTRRIYAINEKENHSVASKKRKSSKERPHEIKTIKIIRKPSPKLNASKKQLKTGGSRKRKSTTAVDPFNFEE